MPCGTGNGVIARPVVRKNGSGIFSIGTLKQCLHLGMAVSHFYMYISVSISLYAHNQKEENFLIITLDVE